MPMNYGLTTPCDSCPFRTDVPFYLRPERAKEIARTLTDRGGMGGGSGGTFPCHKTVDYQDDGDARETSKTQFCAGALIVMEKSGAANQMMRIAERLGRYNAANLNLEAPVFGSLQEFARQRPKLDRGSKKDLAMNLKKKLKSDEKKELERRLKEKPIPKRPKDPPDAYEKLAEGLMHPTKCKADRETERTESEVKPKKKAIEAPEPKAKEKPRAGPSFSVTEINVSKEEKPQLCTKEAALGIFTGWWQEGVLKAELKPVKVLKVLYAMVEENSEELRIKVVALCKLANGEKRRMAAKKYQKRSADRPHYVMVEPTKKPDGDELFNDTPIGRDEFAEKAIAAHKARKEEARRYIEELKRREGLDEVVEEGGKPDAKSYVAELERQEAASRKKKKGKRRRDDDD